MEHKRGCGRNRGSGCVGMGVQEGDPTLKAVWEFYLMKRKESETVDPQI